MRLRGESLDRLGNPTFRLGLQSQEQSQEQLHEDQLITDTADLKMTEDALAEDTAKTQRKIAWKPKQKSRVSRPTTGVCLRN